MLFVQPLTVRTSEGGVLSRAAQQQHLWQVCLKLPRLNQEITLCVEPLTGEIGDRPRFPFYLKPGRAKIRDDNGPATDRQHSLQLSKTWSVPYFPAGRNGVWRRLAGAALVLLAAVSFAIGPARAQTTTTEAEIWSGTVTTGPDERHTDRFSCKFP